MVRLREIPRCAAFAWSPGSALPLVVTGTRAGAVDADFSDETKLELWDLSLDNLEQGVELQPIASISTDSRFHDIAWAPANADHPRGIIAGALENGSLDLWDAEKLIKGVEDAFMSRTTKHTGAIKSLQFNPLKPQILATAGTKGELFIYDINDIANPFRLGTAAARADDLECVAWNRKVPHILATGGGGGFVTVWDLKTKKASLTLNNNRKAVGAIAWDPNNATKLLTATPDDSSPVILLWDLRNSNAPERTLAGHDQGILSLSWCQQDSDLLLSCGKDNRTLVWNPQTGERLGEFPEVTNWTFQTRFNPHNPALSATASFDGKISIQTLQNTNPTATQAPVQGPVDGEDFFTKAQTQPQGASFSLKKAPKWLERPAGASFGFGGKLVSFSLLPVVAGQHRSSKIQISQFSADSDVGSATESFEKALQSGDIASICETHVSEAKTEQEKADWKVIATLIAENPRKKVTEYLGFSDQVEEATNGMAKLGVDEKSDETSGGANGTAANSRLSTLFADGAEGDDFLSTIAATKGAKTDNPFHLFSDEDSEEEKQITKALMLGQFEKAMTICLKEDRIADALIIANCGGKELLEKAQSVYLSRKSAGPNYLRLLTSVIGKNLWDVVYNADLSNWKETMATLCTYADPNEFPDLCEALGDRILETGSPKDASFCYLVGSKLEKVITIWITELEDAEKASIEDLSGDSSFSVHARVLQNFIEKVTVFRGVTKFQDTEQGLISGWKLAPLYDKYNEYADIVAAHGHLSIAERYLDLLPSQYPAAEVARNRVKLASRKAAPKAVQQQPSTARPTPRVQPGIGYQPPAPTPARPAQNNFAPPASTPAPNPYAPPGNSYAPQQPYQQPYQQQPQQQGQQGQQGGYGQPYGSNFGNVPPPINYGAPQPSFNGPPRNTTPSAPPPSKAKDMVNWNDTPMVSKQPRKSTPLAHPSQFQPQQNLAMPPPTGPYGSARATPTPPPPPPKGSAPPRMSSPLTSGPPQPFQQRPSSAANQYAPAAGTPAQQYHQPPPPPTIPRDASPYNAPPGGAPPSSRYAPAPVAQQYSQPPTPQSQVAPPPQAGNRPPPPANAYGPPAGAPQNQYAPSPSPYETNQPPPSFQNQGPPPASQGPPQNSRPPTGQPPKAAQPAAAPSKPKHPAGDRSHIPTSAQRMVDIFSGDMQRVASKAPPSFAAQVKDTQKRLSILFDHLNNEELLKPDTIERLSELAEALNSKNYDAAAKLQVDIQREKTDECGNWMVGVKRLVSMSKVTP
ncbi:Protein transport protein SEC31 [Lachnellula suecica]|uniref:Protein transport protein SEC31 n=1 Tax=Lachnellula suecica TaxID=602035 RepID=A0A8T9CJC6_9HELO|nr:Protein transport protein SEC31 [Lachnellula suecica]